LDEQGKVAEILAVGTDITERRRMEQEREIAVELLEFINSCAGTADLVRAAATFFQEQSGCEAVGIRLKDGDDFPYFEVRGFPEEFVLLENSLCSRDAAGNIVRDAAGDPYIECMCGNVILGRVDPSKPFFAPGGSFWANNTTRLLATTSDADRQTRTRNRCNGEGYESVALIPLRMGTERLGLIQLNDRRQNMFSKDTIALWERLAGYLAVALSRSRAEDDLRRSESEFKLLSHTAGDLLASEDPQGIVNELCRNVMSHLDCQVFFNFLVEEGVGKLHLNACSGIPEEEAQKIEWLDLGAAVCGCVARDGDRIVAEDICNSPDTRTDLVKSYGIRAYACHPLKIGARVIGTLSFGTKTRSSFLPHQLAVMKTVGDQVAVAMERIGLIEGLRKSRDELELRVEERTSELKTYMDKLEESNQALRDFTSIASHDLKEPLRKVATFGGMLRQKYGDSLGEQGKGYLDRVLDAVRRMQSLLTALLEYSRLTTRADPFKEVDLAEIVRDVLSDLEVNMEKTGAEVHVGNLPVVQADPTQMRQLFQNLVGNALKFQKEGEKPVITIVGSSENGRLRITVEDNGIGFDEEYAETIFTPFQRLHGRSGQYEGTGMGLAICRKIVERHGGSILAKSTPGTGSSFIVKLPLRQERDA
jgi:signal transduction histidine kinase